MYRTDLTNKEWDIITPYLPNKTGGWSEPGK
jgi:transposase